MLLKDHKDLKAAITAIPEKEKDKLLLRLIAKDKVLTEHLHFKLLEDESDLEERHQLLKQEIDESVEMLDGMRKATSKDALLIFRKLNGRVNHHYKVTKDLNTEAELRLYLLKNIPAGYNESVLSPLAKFNDRLKTYFLRTTLALYKKYQKLHEDLQYDQKEEFNIVLKKLEKHDLTKAASELGLPKEV
ncbi:hypothetical protein HDF26_004904 [Pedobacter cryoconitis]|uniref:Uncharacterized protein n=1 Tax=Pedobacter cryoconitis TaxID=188932 RepID=A0A7W8ZR46_9SPHI|nr:hypothetical protein [Pedobacter cryoconitis]MBB5638686.1 hypothetical protein [Pedobacter cryoconitis]MBB6274430.1 hypothetical protein [Pedobacter cryoconitis]